ncbi:unnamed protein product [Coffea canephora]|uniref:Uncharacterized protein n=1 Tax=Coffea canephora TaxID=49390 RepID=A0A068UWJ2_COFCA|nr:unnamed protein product [Coffea canephora]
MVVAGIGDHLQHVMGFSESPSLLQSKLESNINLRIDRKSMLRKLIQDNVACWRMVPRSQANWLLLFGTSIQTFYVLSNLCCGSYSYTRY